MPDLAAPRIRQRTERTLSASSSFRPHRPAPLPLTSSEIRQHGTPVHPSSPRSPPYASYSRPRRDSLSTSTPTSPAFPHADAVPPSYSSHRPAPSLSLLQALSRRDIVHPIKFEGAVVVGRSPTSSTSTENDEPQDDLTLKQLSSLETRATSIFQDDGMAAADQVDFKSDQQAVREDGDKAKTVVFAAPPCPHSPSAEMTPRRKAKSFLRMLSLSSRKTTTLPERHALRPRASVDKSLEALPFLDPADSQRPRSVSLPSPIEKPNLDSTSAPEKVDRVEEVPIGVRTDLREKVQTFADRVASPPIVSAGGEVEVLSFTEGEVIRFEPGLDFSKKEKEEEDEEARNELAKLTRRRSVGSQLSSTTSMAAYQSFFGMFESQGRLVAMSDLPRADSVTVPDFRSSRFVPLGSSAMALVDRPNSPSSVYPPTISILHSEDDSAVRRALHGPRIPFDGTTPSNPNANRYSTASTVLSGFLAFPFPPNFSVPTPPPPNVPYHPECSPRATTRQDRAVDVKACASGRLLEASELTRFLAS